MLLIKNGHIKPIVGEELEQGCVLIGDDGKVVSVAAQIPAPEGATVIDAEGRLVTPGCVEMGSNYNNASKLSADDYFTLGRYKGAIYRTTNLQDKILINDVDADPEAVKREQQRIDREIVDFKDHMFGRDSVAMAKAAAEQAKADSIAAADGKVKKDKVAKAPTRRAATPKATTVKAEKPKKQKSASKSNVSKPKSSANRSSNGTLSVRRERR